MRQISFIILIILTFSLFVFSQTSEKENGQIKISVCRPTITDLGLQSYFHFGYVYRVETDDKGSVKQIREVLDHKSRLVDDKDVIPCIKEWRLKPSEKYIISIHVGTTGEQSLYIFNKKDKIKINL